MSLYTQQTYYGQQPYNSSSYAQPPQHGYQYQYQPSLIPMPPQPPVYNPDPVTFRRDYTQRLNELHVNSRPIIQSLSMLAQDLSRYAEIVTQCIEAHIRRVSPTVLSPHTSQFSSRDNKMIWWSVLHTPSYYMLLYVPMYLVFSTLH